MSTFHHQKPNRGGLAPRGQVVRQTEAAVKAAEWIGYPVAVKPLDGGRLVSATVASHEPEGYFEAYERTFTDLGMTDLAGSL